MLYAMMISMVLTFSMLAVAKYLPDPYWNILLHLHEAPLAVFLFCSVGMFMRLFATVPTIKFRGKEIKTDAKPGIKWTMMLAFLMSATTAAYRFTSLKAYVAFSEQSFLTFEPWQHRGNIFMLVLASMAAVISIANLKQTQLKEKLLSYLTAVAALISFTPLLLPDFPPYHPFAIMVVVLYGWLLALISAKIQSRWNIL